MAAGELTSNHVNYLVWRYLQESGYGESAVKLQRDWREDPQDLPFAPFISANALISIVQKGIYYHEIETSLDQDGQPGSTPASASFFGPGPRQPQAMPAATAEDPAVAPTEMVSESSSPRKHPRLAGPDASSSALDATAPPEPKRSRRSTGTAVENGDAMDIDSSPRPETNGTNGVAHHGADVSLKPEQSRPDAQSTVDLQEGQGPAAATTTTTTTPGASALQSASSTSSPAPGATAGVATPPRPTTNGASVGTQSDKIAELGAEASTTSYLDVDGKTVLHCAWSPADPSSLLTAGTEALARIWTVARRLAADEPPGDRDDAAQHDAAPDAALTANGPAYLSLDQAHDRAHDDGRRMVTAISWSQNGEYVAAGLCDSASVFDGNVLVWSRSGRLINTFPVGQYPVLCLRWNLSGSTLLGLCANARGTSIVVWDPLAAETVDSVAVDDPLEDAAWVHAQGFIVSGGRALKVYRIDGAISLIHAYAPPEKDDLWLVRHDPYTGLVATCTHSTTISIYDQRELLQSFDGHSDSVTALEWQPVSNPRLLLGAGPRLLASSSLDGTIHVWDGRRPGQLLHKLVLGRASFPVMTLSFSPDGFALAAASSQGQILVWNSRDGGSPLAAWSGAGIRKKAKDDDDEPMTNGEAANGEPGTEGEQHSLSWDAEGRKLAYAVGRQVAVIDFRR